MEYKIEEKKAPGRDKVKVLGATYEKASPVEKRPVGGGRN